MTVRAKFYVQNKITNADGFAIVLYPVSSGSEENKEFYKFSPAGNISLSTINPAAAEEFEPGKEFYVDFTPAAP